MKNARIKRLVFGISLTLTGAQLAMSTATAVELPELPRFDLVSGLNSGSFSAQESSVTPIEYGSPASGVIGDANDFTGNGASVTIRAGSGAFTPLIVLVDPSSGQVLDYGQGELSGSFTGDVFYLVSSTEAGATGPFTSGIETGGTGGGSGGFLRGAEAAAPMDIPSYLVIGE